VIVGKARILTFFSQNFRCSVEKETRIDSFTSSIQIVELSFSEYFRENFENREREGMKEKKASGILNQINIFYHKQSRAKKRSE
jgi:hypothetical protein